MIKLRTYQTEAVRTATEEFKHYKKPFILQMATGGGKSVVIAKIAEELDANILVLQPSKEILEQNYNKMISLVGDDTVGIYSASIGVKVIKRITFATIGSIKNIPDEFKQVEYIIIDECHQLNSKKDNSMLINFVKQLPSAKVLGLTATPYRIVQKYCTTENGDLFYTAHLKLINRIHPFFWGKIAYKVETDDLQKAGYLCGVKYFSEPVPTRFLKINTTGADFTEQSVEKMYGNRLMGRICDAVGYAQVQHKKALVFCRSLRQANAILSHFEGSIIRLALVDGKTPTKERERLVNGFKSGEVDCLLNVGVFTTGFDVPDLDCIIMARPTMSLGLWYQMIGRGLRLDPLNPEKVLHVYDLSGNTKKLGKVEGIKVKKEEGGFRDEVWTDVGRADEYPLFKWHVDKPMFVKKEEEGEKTSTHSNRVGGKEGFMVISTKNPQNK